MSAGGTAREARRPGRVRTVLAALPLVVGLVLLAYMVSVEGEPGALPLLLILVGAGGLLAARARSRRRPPE